MNLEEAKKYSKYVQNESWHKAHYAREHDGEWLVYDTTVHPAPFLYKLDEKEKLDNAFYPVKFDLRIHFERIGGILP